MDEHFTVEPIAEPARDDATQQPAGQPQTDESAGDVGPAAAQPAQEDSAPPTDTAAYRSQHAIDAAFARRLEAERRKWEARHQQELEALRAQLTAAAAPAESDSERAGAGDPPEAERPEAEEPTVMLTQAQLDERLQAARQEALDRVRRRNVALPDPLRAGSAPRTLTPDYANMPPDQWRALHSLHRQELARGRRVLP